MPSSPSVPATLLNINPSQLTMAQLQHAKSVVALQSARLEAARESLQQSVMRQSAGASSSTENPLFDDGEVRSPQAEASVYMGSMDYLLAKLSRVKISLTEEQELRAKSKQSGCEISRFEKEAQVLESLESRQLKAMKIASKNRRELELRAREKNELQYQRAVAAKTAVLERAEEKTRDGMLRLQEMEEKNALRHEQQRQAAEERYKRYVERQEAARLRLESNQVAKCLAKSPPWKVALSMDESISGMQRGILERDAAREVVIRVKRSKSTAELLAPRHHNNELGLVSPSRSCTMDASPGQSDAFARLTKPRPQFSIEDGQAMRRKLQSKLAKFGKEKREMNKAQRELREEHRKEVHESYDEILLDRQERTQKLLHKQRLADERIQKMREMQEEVRESIAQESLAQQESKRARAKQLSTLPVVDRWAPRAKSVLKSVCTELLFGMKPNERSAVDVEVPLLPSPSRPLAIEKTKSIFITGDANASFLDRKKTATGNSMRTSFVEKEPLSSTGPTPMTPSASPSRKQTLTRDVIQKRASTYRALHSTSP